MRKKVDPVARANSARACSDCLAFTELTPLGEPKCLYGEKLARLGMRLYHHKILTRVTLPAEPIFGFYACKRFVVFCKEMYEKVARSG